MKFLAKWQPLLDEDAHTALAFGFLRHAPVEAALQPWLAAVLGRSVSVEPLEREDFWPSYPSVLDGHHRTEPEIAIALDDGAPLLAVVEVKPGAAMHTFEQISRETIDAAHGEGAARVALVMIGADLGAPPELASWRGELQDAVARHGAEGLEAELHYSSWAELGRAIRRCGVASPAWRRYADDVVTQLQLRGLMGYEGGPVLDDMDRVTVTDAVEAYNRTIKAARQMFLALHGQPAFQAARYEPFGRTFAMVRDGTSSALTQDEDFFTVSVALSMYKRPGWPSGAGAFVAVDLVDEDGPRLEAGAFFARTSDELVWSLARAERVEEVDDARLARADDARLPYARRAEGHTEWVFGERPWQAGDGDADIAWALDLLAAGAAVWDAPTPAA